MKTYIKITTTLAAMIALSTTGIVLAKDKDPHGMMHNKVAIEACQNQIDGANVSFEHPMWDTVNAVCTKMPKGDKLVAAPTKMVAFMKKSQAACVGKSEGDKVSLDDFHNEGEKLEATCKKLGDTLTARTKHKGWKKHDDMMKKENSM